MLKKIVICLAVLIFVFSVCFAHIGLERPMELVIDNKDNIITNSDGWQCRINLHNLNDWENLDRLLAIRPGKAVDFYKEYYLPSKATDKYGNYYKVAWGYKIQKFNKEGKLIKEWGKQGYGKGELLGYGEICVDKNNDYIYVIDREVVINPPWDPLRSQRIQKFDLDGNFISIWDGDTGRRYFTFKWFIQLFGFFRFLDKKEYRFYHASDIAVDSKGCVYIVEDYNCRVQKFNGNGKLIKKWGKRGSNPGEFKFPMAIAVDRYGNVYIADTGNNRIQVFDENGKFVKEIK